MDKNWTGIITLDYDEGSKEEFEGLVDSIADVVAKIVATKTQISMNSVGRKS